VAVRQARGEGAHKGRGLLKRRGPRDHDLEGRGEPRSERPEPLPLLHPKDLRGGRRPECTGQNAQGQNAQGQNAQGQDAQGRTHRAERTGADAQGQHAEGRCTGAERTGAE